MNLTLPSLLKMKQEKIINNFIMNISSSSKKTYKKSRAPLNFSKIILKVNQHLMNWVWPTISNKNICIINTKNWHFRIWMKNNMINMIFKELKIGLVRAKKLMENLLLKKFNSKIYHFRSFYIINSESKTGKIMIYFI